MTKSFDPTLVEGRVQAAFHTIEPDPAFAARLRGQLESASALDPAAPERRSPSWRSPNWRSPVRSGLPLRLAFAALALALVAAVWIIGPQQIAAAARTVIGFIPELGFVEAGDASHLCQPVQVQQNGVTLHVDQGGVGGRRMALRGGMQGIGERTYTPEVFDPQGRAATVVNGSGGGAEGQMFFQYELDLPSGSRTWTLRMTPNDASASLDLTIPLCPGSQLLPGPNSALPTPSAAAADAAAIPVATTTPVGTATHVGTATPVGTATRVATGTEAVAQPAPQDGSAAVNGIEVRVLQSIHDASGAAVQVQAKSLAGGSTAVILLNLGPKQPNAVLVDQAGTVYPLAPLPGEDPARTGGVRTYSFGPLQPESRQLTLRIQQIRQQYAQTADFTFEPGANPTFGQTWDLRGQPGAQVSLDGYTLAFQSARAVRGEVTNSSGIERSGDFLVFDAQISAPAGALGQPCLAVFETAHHHGLDCVPGPAPDQITLIYEADAGLPTEPLHLALGPLTVRIEGPWEVTWPVGD